MSSSAAAVVAPKVSEDVLESVRQAFVKVLKVTPDKITIGTTLDNLESWDSVHHLGLIVEIEKRFKVKFKPAEMRALTSVAAILEHLSQKGIAP